MEVFNLLRKSRARASACVLAHFRSVVTKSFDGGFISIWQTPVAAR